MHYTSGQMIHLLTHGVSLLGPLVEHRFENAWQQERLTSAQKARLYDTERAWQSFKALCKWYQIVLRPSFTLADVVELDEAYFDYQV
jgi:hypothetical protein